MLDIWALAIYMGLCGTKDTCAPHQGGHAVCGTVSVQVLLVGLYLLLCVLYWAWSALQLAAELRDVLDVKHFINNKLGISDRQVCGGAA